MNSNPVHLVHRVQDICFLVDDETNCYTSIDEALMMRKLTGTAADYYYGHDHLYSVNVLFYSTGTVKEYNEYDAYGYARSRTVWGPDHQWFTADDTVVNGGGSGVGNRYFFTGRELDSIDGSSLKIMYYRARSYDPTTGRFLQRDPFGILVENTESEWDPSFQYHNGNNIYLYVMNTPLSFLDPMGLAYCDDKCNPGSYGCTSLTLRMCMKSSIIRV